MAFTPGRMNRFGRGCFRNHTTIKVWWGGEGEVRGRWQAQQGVDGEEGERKINAMTQPHSLVPSHP